MTKIWSEAFWKPAAGGPGRMSQRLPAAALAASAALAVVTVALGLGAEALWSVAESAAHQLYEPDAYLEAVLGSRT
jgi:multicomponent Na+:H+ antiporter subunit D